MRASDLVRARLAGVVGVVLLLAAGCGLGGCAGAREVAGLREAVAASRDAMIARASALDQAAEQAERSGDHARAEGLRLDASRLHADAAAAGAGVRQLDALLAEHDRLRRDPLFEGLGALVPEPLRSPILLGAAALAAAWRARQLKSGLASVAKSLDKAMRSDPQLAERFRAHAPTLRSIQTRTAHRVIDEATRNETMLRLPL